MEGYDEDNAEARAYYESFLVVPDSEECPSCGERVWIGDWPFCASLANPTGHTRGTYRFRMKFTMKTQGWTRRER